MLAQALILVVFIVVGAAVAVPYLWLERNRRRERREASALVIGGAALGGGLGLIAFGLFAASASEIEPWILPMPLLIVAASLLALLAEFRLSRWARRGLLVAASLLSLAGAATGAAFVLAGAGALLASLCYVLALADSPRALLRALDPR